MSVVIGVRKHSWQDTRALYARIVSLLPEGATVYASPEDQAKDPLPLRVGGDSEAMREHARLMKEELGVEIVSI